MFHFLLVLAVLRDNHLKNYLLVNNFVRYRNIVLFCFNLKKILKTILISVCHIIDIIATYLPLLECVDVTYDAISCCYRNVVDLIPLSSAHTVDPNFNKQGQCQMLKLLPKYSFNIVTKFMLKKICDTLTAQYNKRLPQSSKHFISINCLFCVNYV